MNFAVAVSSILLGLLIVFLFWRISKLMCKKVRLFVIKCKQKQKVKTKKMCGFRCIYNADKFIARSLLHSISFFIFLVLMLVNTILPDVFSSMIIYFPIIKYSLVALILLYFLCGGRYFDNMRQETNNRFFSVFIVVCNVTAFIPMWIQMLYFILQSPNPITIFMAVIFYVLSTHRMILSILDMTEEYIVRSLVFLIYSACLIGYTYFSFEITYSFSTQETMVLVAHILSVLQGKTENVVAVIKTFDSLSLESVFYTIIVLWEVMIMSNLFRYISKDKTIVG